MLTILPQEDCEIMDTPGVFFIDLKQATFYAIKSLSNVILRYSCVLVESTLFLKWKFMKEKKVGQQ